MGGGTGVGVTVSATGATGSTSQGITTPPGQVLTGTIQDIQTNTVINFSQAFGAEIGLQVGSKVNYTTVTCGGQTVANVLKLLHKGEIVTINATDDGGTLLNKASGLTIPFAQSCVAASGILVGSKVNFESIVDPVSGQITAVALEVINA